MATVTKFLARGNIRADWPELERNGRQVWKCNVCTRCVRVTRAHFSKLRELSARNALTARERNKESREHKR